MLDHTVSTMLELTVYVVIGVGVAAKFLVDLRANTAEVGVVLLVVIGCL